MYTYGMQVDTELTKFLNCLRELTWLSNANSLV